MELLSIQPQPCADSNCRGQHPPGERVALAVSLCSARGAQLTTLRRTILELLWESGRPTGAYELMEALKLSPRTAPNVVPRAVSTAPVQKISPESAGTANTAATRRPYLASSGSSIVVKRRRRIGRAKTSPPTTRLSA